jgi:hypothetical protein
MDESSVPRMTYSQFLLIKMRIEENQILLMHSIKNGKGCDIGYAPSASSLRESQQRGRMYRRSP